MLPGRVGQRRYAVTGAVRAALPNWSALRAWPSASINVSRTLLASFRGSRKTARQSSDDGEWSYFPSTSDESTACARGSIGQRPDYQYPITSADTSRSCAN